MTWNKDHTRELRTDSERPSEGGPSPEDVYQETEEERRAYIDDLRAQIASGTYKPSIGRISVSIFGDLAE